jgi:hypothetical protein
MGGGGMLPGKPPPARLTQMSYLKKLIKKFWEKTPMDKETIHDAPRVVSPNEGAPLFYRVKPRFRKPRFPIDRKANARGPRPDTWWKRKRTEPTTPWGDSPPEVFTRPEPAIQRPVGTNSCDRKGFRRCHFGGIVRDKKRIK